MDPELYELMTELGRRGYLVHNYQLDQVGPLVVAAVMRRGACADVLILHDEHNAYAFRTPTGNGQDVLDPAEVMWDCAAKPVRALRALLDLPQPNDPTAPTVIYAPQPGLCLSAARRGEAMTVRRRGDLMKCPDCQAGHHQRTEVAVDQQETVTLRWYVCECGICPQPCRTLEVGVETSRRWRHQHRFHEGALVAAPFAGCETMPAGRHAAGDTSRDNRTAVGRTTHRADPDLPAARAATACPARIALPAPVGTRRHQQPVMELGRDTDPTTGGQECRGTGRG